MTLRACAGEHTLAAFPVGNMRGNWPLLAASCVDHTTALADMGAYYDAGITAFNCADIYTGVEEMIGEFRSEYRNRRGAASPLITISITNLKKQFFILSIPLSLLISKLAFNFFDAWSLDAKARSSLRSVPACRARN